MELDLDFSIDSSYASLYPDTISVPSIPGVAFYTSQTGGTELTSNGDGDVIEQACPPRDIRPLSGRRSIRPHRPPVPSPSRLSRTPRPAEPPRRRCRRRRISSSCWRASSTPFHVSPYTVFALSYLQKTSVALSTKYMWFNHYDVTNTSIAVADSFNGLIQGISWFEDAVRTWAYADSADYCKMVQAYALNERTVNSKDMVKVLADTSGSAQYWTKAFANIPSGSMPGTSQMATTILYTFTGCTTSWSAAKWAAAGTTPPPVAMGSYQMSAYYWDIQ